MAAFIPTRADAQPAAKPHLYWAYIGNTTNNGIGLFKLDTDTGKLTNEGIAAPASSPGFLTIAPDQKHLYAGITIERNVAGIAAYDIDAKTGRLRQINVEKSGSDEADYVSVDPQNKNVLASHWGDNGPTVVSVLPIGDGGKVMPPSSVVAQTGSGPVLPQQSHAHPHFINADVSGNYAFACDYGADKIFFYKLDSMKGLLTPNDPPSLSMPPGSAPRQMAFHPNNRWVYVLNELGGTVAALNHDAAKGTLSQIEIVSAMKPGFNGKNRSAAVSVHPSGKFLYTSHRDDTNFVTVFSIDPSSGKLKVIDYTPSLGHTPRDFRIDPTGQYLLLGNQDSQADAPSNLVLFKIDQETGKLTKVGGPILFASPICVKFLAAE
jgi:6-phosphogluconolactonase